jgi:hypothetical protein
VPVVDPERSDGAMTHDLRFWFLTILAVLRRPGLWATARRQWFRMVPPQWWRRAPFLPLPDRAYVRFRLETAYGAHATGRAADVVTYLEWCRATERQARGQAQATRSRRSA